MNRAQKLSKHQGKHQHDPFCLAAGMRSCAAVSPVSGRGPTDASAPAHLWQGPYVPHGRWVTVPNSAVRLKREITPKREGHGGCLGKLWAEGEQAAHLKKKNDVPSQRALVLEAFDCSL